MSTEGKRITIKADDPMYMNRPNVNGAKFLCNGEVRPWSGKVADVESPIFLEGTETKIVIGNQARMSPAEALEALDAAVAAWNKGKGEWPQMTAEDRIAAMEKFVAKLKLKRDAIVNVLMWEICKVRPDAEKEFDRTMDYIAATIKAVRKMRRSLKQPPPLSFSPSPPASLDSLPPSGSLSLARSSLRPALPPAQSPTRDVS